MCCTIVWANYTVCRAVLYNYIQDGTHQSSGLMHHASLPCLPNFSRKVLALQYSIQLLDIDDYRQGQSSHIYRILVIRGENVSKFNHGENVRLDHSSLSRVFAIIKIHYHAIQLRAAIISQAFNYYAQVYLLCVMWTLPFAIDHVDYNYFFLLQSQSQKQTVDTIQFYVIAMLKIIVA